MSTPKKTKYRAIFKLEDAVIEMKQVGFSIEEIKEIIWDIFKDQRKKDKKLKSITYSGG